MHNGILVTVALLPAFIFGAYLPSISALLGCKLNEVLEPPKNTIFVLIVVPWMIIVVSWATAMFLLSVPSSPDEISLSVVKGMCLAVWAAGFGLGFRRSVPAMLNLLSDWVGSLQRRFS